MRLENYIMEQDINTASVADIFVEQAQAELDVALALLNANIKEATFQEFAVYQEGELGDSVSAARAEVRSDGKKHHLKAAAAAIKAFFKFIVTKVSSFFKKSATYGDAASKKMEEAIKEAEAVTGEEMDIKLPTTREDYKIIKAFFSELNSGDLKQIIDAFEGMIDRALNQQNTFTDSTSTAKLTKVVDKFVNEVEKLKLASKPNSKFDSEKAKKKALKKGYQDAYGEPKNDSLYVLDTKLNEWVLVTKKDPSEWMGKAEFDELNNLIKKTQKEWEPNKKRLIELQKQVDSLITSAGTVGAMNRPVRPQKPDGKYDKGEFKKSVEQYKKDAAAYDTEQREVNKNRIFSALSREISRMTKAITTMTTVAEGISKEALAIASRASAKSRDKYDLKDEYGNPISAGEAAKRRREALANGKDTSFKKKDDDISGIPEQTKWRKNRTWENSSSSDDSTDVDGITFTRALK
jgi:hypothetical protein